MFLDYLLHSEKPRSGAPTVLCVQVYSALFVFFFLRTELSLAAETFYIKHKQKTKQPFPSPSTEFDIRKNTIHLYLVFSRCCMVLAVILINIFDIFYPRPIFVRSLNMRLINLEFG
jgi:hypothetical protein